LWLRAGEVVRLRAGDIDSEQMIIRVVQSRAVKDRHVMLRRRSSTCCGDGGRRGRPSVTLAFVQSNVGCFPVALIINR